MQVKLKWHINCNIQTNGNPLSPSPRMNPNLHSPITMSKHSTPLRNDRTRKFMRKPGDSSQRSSSKKSVDTSSIRDMYIKSPTAVKINTAKQEDFFVSLASSIIKNSKGFSERRLNHPQSKPEPTDRTNLTEFQDLRNEARVHHDQDELTIRNLNLRVKTLQAELDLRNHQASILSSQCQRLKKGVEEERERRKAVENEKKDIARELKQLGKSSEALKAELKKIEKQRQHLIKQIQFFQRINYDDKTRSLQSYRQTYLEHQLQQARCQLQKSHSQRQLQLQTHIKSLKQQKYTIESHLKAIKLANECLIKQINNNQEGLHDLIMNSEEYVKLRDKYVRFLEEYKLLRNQYWALKAEVNGRKGNSQESEIFSITASEVENDLSELKGASGDNTEILKYLTVPHPNHNILAPPQKYK